MPTLSCTKKVRDKLKKHKLISDEKVDTGLQNWYVDLLRIKRKEYYLFTNSVTLYSLLIYMGTEKERKNLEQIFFGKLKEAIVADFGVPASLVESIFLDEEEFVYTKTNSRSVLGVMNDFKFQVEVFASHHQTPEGRYEEWRSYLNKCPVSTINYSKPMKEMEKILNLEKKS